MNAERGILITRTDRIGDVVLSLPVIKTISRVYPDEPLYMMVSSYAYPIVENYPGLTSVIRYEPDEGSNKVSRTKQLIQHVRDLRIKKALMLVYDADVLSIIKKAGIKERYGPLTKISGMFNYTKWRPQHRSKVEQHELEYNLSLLEMLGIKEHLYDATLDLPVSKNNVTLAHEILRREGFENPSVGYIIVHPGCGGSALNWRYAYYAEVASRLAESTGLPIVLTGKEEESGVLSAIKQHIRGVAYNTAGKFSLKELIALISEARLFIGPSTGPMHIAAATSVPVVAVFSPLRVQSVKRWGPYSKDSVAVAPRVECPAKLKCMGKKCEYYNCMDMVSVDEVYEKARKIYDESIQQMGLGFYEN
jgi:heptosyltransferase-3